MMKLILSLTLIWTLCSTAGALQCQNCTDVACSITRSITCPPGTMCITASILANLNGMEQNQIFKSCALPSLCPSTGPQTFSASLLAASVLASAECCNTDDCNAPTQPAPVLQPNNGQLCPCSPPSSMCSVPCRGAEDTCFQANVTNGILGSPVFGCASGNFCTAATIQEGLPFLETTAGTITSGPICSLIQTTAAPTTAAPTTAAPTTAAPTTAATTTATTTTAATTTSAPVYTTTASASDASYVKLGMIHLFLGLLILTIY